MIGKQVLPTKKFSLNTKTSLNRILTVVFLSCCALFLLSSASYKIDKVTERGTLRVIGVVGPTTFLTHGSDNIRGLQYELLRKFAEELNLTLEIKQAPNAEAVTRALRAGEADIGITGLASRDSRLKNLLLTTPYLHEQQQRPMLLKLWFAMKAPNSKYNSLMQMLKLLQLLMPHPILS